MLRDTKSLGYITKPQIVKVGALCVKREGVLFDIPFTHSHAYQLLCNELIMRFSSLIPNIFYFSFRIVL